MALVAINGRQHFISANEVKIAKVGAGRWSVAYDGRQFDVVGGCESGGARNEWFCIHPEFYGPKWLPCTSMVQAVKMGCVC
jgi:hypothetical protein